MTTLTRAQIDHPPPVSNIRLDDLSNGPGLLPFRLGKTKIISHDHTFLQEIDLYTIQQLIDSQKLQLTDALNKIPNHKFNLFKHQAIHLSYKLNKISTQLKSFEPRRVKRGLINPLGTIIKSITGNLDNDDALRFENALKILQKNDQESSINYNKHISLYKEMTFQQTQVLSNLSSNQQKLVKAFSFLSNKTSTNSEEITIYSQLFQLFSILSENAQDLSYEISRLENILAFSRTHSMHHSILSINDLITMISKLKAMYSPDEILNLDLRYYYDIISLGSYYIDQRIVIVLKFPIMSPHTYNLYRICPVPNKNSKIILPPFPYIATNSKEFVYMEAECPKIDTWYICAQRASRQTRNQRDCIHHLIHKQEADASCNSIPVSLSKEALLELDSQHYIISFPKQTIVQMNCGQEEQHALQGSFLATVPRNCNIKTPEFTIVNIDDKLRGHAVEIITIPQESSSSSANQSPYYNLTTIDLNKLHNIQHQVMMEVPIKTDTIDFSSIYHTTIPIYIIVILGAAALSVICYLHKGRSGKLNLSHEMPEQTLSSPNSSRMSLQERKAATFALDIGK